MAAARAPRSKITRSNAQQLNVLVDFMSTNTFFAVGEYTGPLGGQKMEAEWVKLKEQLANYGPDKSVEQWKHTWRDLKKKARDDGGRVRLALNATGNAVPVPELSERTNKILAIIGQEMAMGMAVEQESGVGDNSEVRAAVSSSAYMVVYEDDELRGVEEEVIIDAHAPAVLADDVPAPAPVRTPAARPRARRAPAAARARVARPRARLAQPPSAAFIEAQRDTNSILKDISNEMLHQQSHQIWKMRHQRRAQGGGVQKLKF